jgi:hypothetical protein
MRLKLDTIGSATPQEGDRTTPEARRLSALVLAEYHADQAARSTDPVMADTVQAEVLQSDQAEATAAAAAPQRKVSLLGHLFQHPESN